MELKELIKGMSGFEKAVEVLEHEKVQAVVKLHKNKHQQDNEKLLRVRDDGGASRTAGVCHLAIGHFHTARDVAHEMERQATELNDLVGVTTFGVVDLDMEIS